MAGPGASNGAIGERDGRVDVFLGPGDHKAVLSSLRSATAAPVLTVRPFEEANGSSLPVLVETSLVAAELSDLQQRSYWLKIDSRRTVLIEAAGRHLADLRIWQEGTWLVDVAPAEEVSEPTPGKPFGVRRLVATIDPGMYLVTAYGGAGAIWTEEGPERPLYLRWGIPSLPETGYRQLVAGPLGFDRWLVPSATNTFHLELPNPGSARIEVANYNDGNIGSGRARTIDKRTANRSADLTSNAGTGGQVVTITRQAGLPYLLYTYVARWEHAFEGSGDYVVGTMRPGHGEDDADDTAVLTRFLPATSPGGRPTEQIIASRTIEVGQSTAWHRRFNLLDPTQLFVSINESGQYTVETSGPDVTLSFAPFLTTGTLATRQRTVVRSGTWDLDSGTYVLSISPRQNGRGVLSLTVKGAAAMTEATPAQARLGATFLPIHLDSGNRYRLYFNRTASGPGGAIVRRLPVDASLDLPLTLEPCMVLTLPVSFPGAGSVMAVSADGDPLPLSLDGGNADASATLAAPGVRLLEVANQVASPRQVLLRFTPESMPVPPPLPAVSAEDLAKLPDFPELLAQKPAFIDLDRKRSATFIVKVDKPALYRVETGGLLETSGTIRTQIRPLLDSASSNGVGRNFLLQQYLREGIYQLMVQTLGQTKGHLSVGLSVQGVSEGGALTLGVPAHFTLPSGLGLAYGVDVSRPGRYHFQTMTLGGATGVRVEDSGGWPLHHPGQTGDVSFDLVPGRYRVVVLPMGLTARVQTLVEQEKTDLPPPRSGSGPHPLPLEGKVQHRWEEPASGEPRAPQLWSFELPAAADMTLAVSEMMRADIRREDSAEALASFNFRKPWKGRLQAGRYRLEVVSLQANNLFDYEISTAVEQLLAGQERRVNTPATIPVSLSGGQPVEISSWGVGEVRGTLLDTAGNVVARAIDRPDDWNFNITASPPAGEYRLKVETLSTAHGGPKGSTVVRVRQFEQVEEAPLQVAASKELADGRMHVFPLALSPKDGTFVIAAARSHDPVGLSLERRKADGTWEMAGSAAGRDAYLAVARDPDAKSMFRLYVWPIDRTSTPIALQLRSATPTVVSEASLAKGVSLTEVPGFDPPLGIAAIKPDQPGLFRLEMPHPSVTWSTATDHRALARESDVVITGGAGLWFAGTLAAGPVKARRIIPEANAPLALTLPEEQTVGLPVPVPASGAVAWILESRVGQPGIGVDATSDARSMGLGRGLAVAVLPETRGVKDPLVRLWRADRQNGDLPVWLRQVGFSTVSEGSLPLGITDAALAAGAAVRYSLPGGSKRLRLALPPNVVAALLKDRSTLRTIWSGDVPAAEVFNTSADTLLLLNPGAADGPVSVALARATAEDMLLTRGLVSRQWLPHRGARRFEVTLTSKERGKGLLLRLAGAVENATLVQRDGTVRTGTSLSITDDAVLTVNHGIGLVAVWLDNGDEEAWPPAAALGGAKSLAVPGTVTLAGAEMLWRVDAESAMLLHVASASPLMTGLRRAKDLPELSVWGEGGALHAFLPEGKTLLALRPLVEGSLSGTAEFAQSKPVAIGEGLGPKVRLMPGDARLFSFDLGEASSVGIGVRGHADTARVRLLGSDGKTWAEGATAMANLPAGRFYLLVENRPDGDVTEFQPALVGTARPSGPPEDVKRQYWELITEGEGN